MPSQGRSRLVASWEATELGDCLSAHFSHQLHVFVVRKQDNPGLTVLDISGCLSL